MGRRRSLARALCPLLAALLLAACSRQGDFDRLEHAPGHSAELRALGAYFGWRRHQPVSAYPYTDLEKDLRARAYAFLVPAGQTGLVGATIAEWRIVHLVATRHPASDPGVYYRSLDRPSRRSTASLWQQLIADMRHEEARIAPFAKTAFLVAQADRARYWAMREGELILDDVRNAYARLDENHRLVGNVNLALADRIAAYAHALEKARLAAPDEREAAARFALADLRHEANKMAEVLAYYDKTEGVKIPLPDPDPAPIRVVPPPPIVELGPP